MTGGSSTSVVALLPVRNGEEDLPHCLSSLEAIVDAIVALDDGSTDRTAEILEAHPKVKVLLRNERRETAAGWDDSLNRNRLLAASSDLGPDWILSLDADESIDHDDATALRRFLEYDAVPGFAYGFRVFRMIGDLDHYDRSDLWVYRLFSYDPDHRFPPEQFHFVPVPRGIPSTRWLKTTIRIRHLGSLTEQRRLRRIHKYAEADPEGDYSHLLAQPREPRSWETRPPDLPVLLKDAERPVAASLDLDAPALSVIVISQNDRDRIEAAVRAVVEQECPDPFEVIVVNSGTDGTAEVVERGFPDVRLVRLPRGALPGAARNAGLGLARGDYVSFPGSHVELEPGALAARIRAHESGFAMVTGSIVNGTLTRSGWASYFLDHSGSLPGRPTGPLKGAPSHCSYVRHLLVEAGGFPEDVRAGEDTVANNSLHRLGHRGYRAQDIRLIHRSPCRNPGKLVAHHFIRGRGLGRILVDRYRTRGGLMGARPLRRYLRRRMGGTSERVEKWGEDLRPLYRRAYPFVLTGALAAWAGAWYEVLRPGRGKLRILLGRGVDVEYDHV